MTAAYTSVKPSSGCSVKMWPPHVLHHLRWLCGVLLKVPIFSSPRVILTFSGCHKVKALMGAADQWRQELQCVREIERALDPQSPVAQNS